MIVYYQRGGAERLIKPAAPRAESKPPEIEAEPRLPKAEVTAPAKLTRGKGGQFLRKDK